MIAIQMAIGVNSQIREFGQKSGGKPGVPSGAAPLGWKPAFLTPRLLDLLDCLDVESLSGEDHGFNSN